VQPAPSDTEHQSPLAEPVPLPEAYAFCESIVRRHVENFPVASRFLAPGRRHALSAIYAFARQADDVADATEPTRERLDALSVIESALLRAVDGSPEGPIFTALADTIDRHRLPIEPFLDLLSAFRQDARNETFQAWDDLLGYCRGSANPVGRLVLALHEIEDPDAVRASDALCTALQLTNLWQDLARDLERGRLFLPLEDLAHFGLTREDLTRPAHRAALSRLLVHECRATDELYERGRAVTRTGPLPLRIQLRATFAGGRAVLREVERSGWHVLRRRPTLGRVARARILLQALVGHDV
jgi:squalene synthase HpnC